LCVFFVEIRAAKIRIFCDMAKYFFRAASALRDKAIKNSTKGTFLENIIHYKSELNEKFVRSASLVELKTAGK